MQKGVDFALLSVEQILVLQKDPFYKKTRGIRYNWKHSKTIVSAPAFSIKLDVIVDGKPWEQWKLFWKIFVFLFNRFIISKEIGVFRNNALERILNSSIGDNFDICSLITPNLKWISRKSEKIAHMKNFILIYITELDVQLCIYNSVGLSGSKRDEFIEKLHHKINCVFDYTIALLMKDASIASRKEFDRFIEMHGYTLTSFFKEHGHTGNLFTVSFNDEEGNDNG